MCDKNQAGQWQRGIATPCRSHRGDPLGAGKAALTLTDSSFFSVCLNQMPVEQGGGRPWAPPSLLTDESEGFGSSLLTLTGKEASKDKMLWPLQCWLPSWGCLQDTLWLSPGHPEVHCRIHPRYDVSLQHRWSSLKAAVALSASQQRLLRPFWTPWLKWQILLMLTKENCYLSEAQQQLESLCSL